MDSSVVVGVGRHLAWGGVLQRRALFGAPPVLEARGVGEQGGYKLLYVTLAQARVNVIFFNKNCGMSKVFGFAWFEVTVRMFSEKVGCPMGAGL